jgi:hypothetical protein
MLEETESWAEAMAAWIVDVGVELVEAAPAAELERLCWYLYEARAMLAFRLRTEEGKAEDPLAELFPKSREAELEVSPP